MDKNYRKNREKRERQTKRRSRETSWNKILRDVAAARAYLSVNSWIRRNPGKYPVSMSEEEWQSRFGDGQP